VRVNLAGQKGHSLVCGSCGTFPLCERIRETVPSFLYSTGSSLAGTDDGGGIVFCSGVAGDAIEKGGVSRVVV
jgi:hypothetical protein